MKACASIYRQATTFSERWRAGGWLDSLRGAGITPVTGRCTYYAPLVSGCDGRVVTNSAKWAYYAAGGLGSRPTFASLEDCVDAATTGRIASDVEFWADES